MGKFSFHENAFATFYKMWTIVSVIGVLSWGAHEDMNDCRMWGLPFVFFYFSNLALIYQWISAKKDVTPLLTTHCGYVFLRCPIDIIISILWW